MLIHSSRDQHRPSSALGKTWAVLGRRTVRPTHLGGPVGKTDSLQINLRGPGRDGSPSTYSSWRGPNAKGQRMNEPQIRPSLAGQGGPRERSPVGILEGFSESAPRQDSRAGEPAPPPAAAAASSQCTTHLRPLEGPARAPAPQPPGSGAHFSREPGTPGPPRVGAAGGAGGGVCAGDRRGSNASRAESNGGNSAVCEAQDGGRRGRHPLSFPEGEATGRVRPGYWPPADPPRRCVHHAVALGSPAPAPRLGLLLPPTYLRRRLRLRVEAHAELLDGTRKLVVRFGSGPEEAGEGDACSLAGRAALPAPCSAFPVTRASR